MTNNKFIAFYGGTFDPIHYGHLCSAISLARLVNLEKIIFLPNKYSQYKCNNNGATSKQRLDMLQLSLKTNKLINNLFIIDKRELQKSTFSLTINTFESLRIEYGSKVPLGFIIGQDSLLTLPQWIRGYELLNLCHIIVFARPGYINNFLNETDNKWFISHSTKKFYKLLYHPSGLIYFANTPKIDISSTEIRKRYNLGLSCYGMVPLSINNYIITHNLYR